jgi:hypothetical protein
VTNRSPGRTVLVWVFRLLLVGGVLAVFFLPPVSTLSSTTDTATVRSYDETMDLSADGTLRSVEKLAVDLPFGKHGIFRIFDTADPRRNGIDHPVTDVTVLRNGVAEPYEWTASAQGTQTLKIGLASRTVGGAVNEYTIASRTTDALEPGKPGETLWWWDVVGSGWQMPMEAVSVTATLPADPIRAECVQGKDTPCSASIEGRTMKVVTGPLEPFTPVTVRVAFRADSLPAPPAGTRWSSTLLWSALAGVLAAALGAYFIVATRERRPGFPVLFEPPAGISPALGARVLRETDSADDLQATLYDLGERGVLRLEGDDASWRVHLLVDPATAGLSEGEAAVLSRLQLGSAGESFLVSSTKTAGEHIAKAQEVLREHVGTESERYLRSSAPGVWAKLLGWVAIVGLLVLIGVYFFTTQGWHSYPLLVGLGVFAVVVLGVVVDPATGTKHTPEGQDMWSRTGGFARFLTTDSSESRFDAAAHLDWFPRYLAWALVFGSADAWARRYASQGVDVPVVPWLYWSGHPTNQFVGSSIGDSFNSAITSASATYAASQSSSGGGGGFSGGSGGGGGGGGSW